MRIAVGADHAGFQLKQVLSERLRQSGHEILDCGTHSTERVDYPDYGAAVGRAVAGGEADLGVCVCGSGNGIAMAANKITGVRAAVAHDVTSARLAKAHNDANVLCIGERLTGAAVAGEALDAWLAASFEGGRHQARVAKLDTPGSRASAASVAASVVSRRRPVSGRRLVLRRRVRDQVANLSTPLTQDESTAVD